MVIKAENHRVEGMSGTEQQGLTEKYGMRKDEQRQRCETVTVKKTYFSMCIF